MRWGRGGALLPPSPGEGELGHVRGRPQAVLTAADGTEPDPHTVAVHDPQIPGEFL